MTIVSLFSKSSFSNKTVLFIKFRLHLTLSSKDINMVFCLQLYLIIKTLKYQFLTKFIECG